MLILNGHKMHSETVLIDHKSIIVLRFANGYFYVDTML